MKHTQVRDLMEKNTVLISPMATLGEAAALMRENDCGCLPVGGENRLEGVITDRDIVVRAIAQGQDPARAKVRDVMTEIVCTCREDDTLSAAAEIMSHHNVGRLVVMDKDNALCGILSFGRVLRRNDSDSEILSVVRCATGKTRATAA